MDRVLGGEAIGMTLVSGTPDRVVGGTGRTGKRAAGRPRTPRVYVERTLLWRLLDDAAQGALTVVTGPAGAGKSLGVAGWLWAQKDEPDAAWLNASALMTPAVLRDAIAGPESASGGRPRLVVIDDAHLLPTRSLAVINDLLARTPDRIRIILLTPWDLPIEKLGPGLLGHLTIIRGDVLRLTRDEAAILVAAHARSGADDVLDAVLEETEGWCAATVLVSRAIGAAADVHAAARDHGRNATVATGVASPAFAALSDAERHVLLCTGSEETVSPSVAVALTGDPSVGETLARLADVGLLVTRVDRPEPGPEAGAAAGSESDYRIHPMLREVIRLLHLAGGDDVRRARAAVAAAARADIGRGDVIAAFRRFAFAGDPDAAAELLADHPLELVASAAHRSVRAFERRHADVVQRQPRTWWPLALERWLAGDCEGAGHWSARVLSERGGEDDRARADAACALLLRSRTGLEPVPEAIAAGRAALDGLAVAVDREEVRLLLSLELGIAENWRGDLEAAERDLTEAAMLARARSWHGLRAKALSHLALTEFMRGREQNAMDQATAAIELLDLHPGFPGALAVRDRAMLVQRIVALGCLPISVEETSLVRERGSAAGPDLLAEFWARHADAAVLTARRELAQAQRLVEPPWAVPDLPAHLQLVALSDRVLIALMRRDGEELGSLAAQLIEVDAHGESALALGLRADLDGRLRQAEEQLEAAAAAPGRRRSDTVAMAFACRAQLAAARADQATALDCLESALTATEDRRHLVPFLGWSRHGSPIAAVLTALQAVRPSAWGAEVLREIADRPTVWEFFATGVAPDAEEPDDDDVVRSQLSPRELEVLRELARGATYADVASALYVSLNTVKTHVSSLYAKLGVTCRTDALSVARRLYLI